MLFCEPARSEARDFEDLAVFLSQLSAASVAAGVDVRAVPPDLSRNAQFDLAPYLLDRLPEAGDGVLLLGAHRLTDARLLALRRLARPGVGIAACAELPTRQAEIGLRAKLSYLFGHEPLVLNVSEQGNPELGAQSFAPIVGVVRRRQAALRPRVLIVTPGLTHQDGTGTLAALAYRRRFDVSVLMGGQSKQEWQDAHGTVLPIFHYGEALPVDLASQVDICVCLRPPGGNFRLQTLLANIAVTGGVLLDATRDHAMAALGDAFIRAPFDAIGLADFLETEVLPNLAELGRRTANSRVATEVAVAARPVLEALLRAHPKPDPPGGAREIVFTPTNGIGLGHAQRCATIAREFEGGQATFAAFPSCIGLVRSFGFDVMPLIGRSAFHAQPFENDLANYMRLRALTRGGRTFVFDGGYVFDSIYRTILENGLAGIWIRRGLWQAQQNNAIALDREKIFTRVLVPREAFAELNRAYSTGERVMEVGPIVNLAPVPRDRREGLRQALAERYGVSFDRLVVSLLGGGVAAERTVQTQALCGMMETRGDTLHLVVVWPGGKEEPGWFGWQRTRVVRTHHASTLIAASDLCIAAAGYNIFHEVLYGRNPAIFLPQAGPFMDDQRARAEAARDREIAGLVEPTELARLERMIARYLDLGEVEMLAARLSRTELPEPGNAEAAQRILEVHRGANELRTGDVADYPLQRGRPR